MLRVLRLMRNVAYARPSADYYKVLELENDASEDDIKASFYKLSQLYHPTLNTSESKTNFQLLNEAYVILSDVKSRRAYDLINRVDPQTTVTPPKEQEVKPKTAYQLSREQKIDEFKKRYNIDEFGRFKGGLPQKRKGSIRGTSLQQTGHFFSHLIHQQQVDNDPDYQYVTPQVANSFKKFHQDQRQFRSYKWPWFKINIEYDTFRGKRLLKVFDFSLIFLILAFAIPAYFKNFHYIYIKSLQYKQFKEAQKKAVSSQ